MKLFKYLNRPFYPAFLILASLTLQSCSVGGQLLKQADSFKTLTKDEIIVVGTIELSPGLAKDEQKLNPDGVLDLFGYGDMNKNRCMIQFNSEPVVDSYKSMINPELGKVYFFKLPRNMKYMVEGSVLTEFSRHGNLLN